MNPKANPSEHELPLRLAEFATLAEGLDYAADGATGFDFYEADGTLRESLPYRELRRRARDLARRLLGTGLERGDRVAAVAETGPEFAVLFFACQYAGLVPVALPLSINFGNHDAYVEQLRGLLEASSPGLALAPDELLPLLEDAAEGLPGSVRTGTVAELEASTGAAAELRPTGPHEVAYLQFTSGSTRFPRGVVITEAAVMSNLRGIVKTMDVRPGDRSVSWLPLYHDMGMVGFLLAPMVSQLSVDFLRPRDFAVRPVQWLRLISRNRGTVAFAPPIGYELCTRRLRSDDLDALDLSSWRVAGVGAEMVRTEPLDRFADTVEAAGFDRRAFLPCYGLAESSLAVTFPALGDGVSVERLDAEALSERGVAVPSGSSGEVIEVVNCGDPLPEHEVVIRDASGRPLPHRTVGRVTLRGPSVMKEYFDDPEATREVLTDDGWLDTGDLGYRTEEGLFITGRRKDLIIVSGRNIWPQDLEYLAEQQPEVRIGETSAFAVTEPDGVEKAVLVVQCRTSEPAARDDLVSRIQSAVYRSYGIRCIVELVPPRTLPRTSSGKLSRTEAKRGFLERVDWDELMPTARRASRA